MHFQLLAQLSEKLREVIGKRIVVVEKQNHRVRSACVLPASVTNRWLRKQRSKGKYKVGWEDKQINTPARASCWGLLLPDHDRISCAFRRRNHRVCPARAS